MAMFEFLSLSTLSTFFTFAAGFILALAPLVFIHELGHYWAAKACGVHVEKFSIGFGPELYGWTNSAGTRWKICLFPLGGYVQMAGDTNAASSVVAAPEEGQDVSRTLYGKSPFHRIAIAVAGPLANYLLAFIMLMGLFTTVGRPIPEPRLGMLDEKKIGYSAGLRQGDCVQYINHKRTESFEEVVQILKNTSQKEPLLFQIMRENMPVDVQIPSTQGTDMWIGNLGIGLSPDARISYVPLFWRDSINVIGERMNPSIFFGSLSLKNMGGPIALAQQAGNVIQSGLVPFLFFCASLSIALGFFNMLPFPLLDGGMVVMSIVEIIIRRPLSTRVQTWLSRIAMIVLGTFFITISWQDLQKIAVVRNLMTSLTQLITH